MRAVVIGGTGHIGMHLIPMLVRDGTDVCVIARGRSAVPPTDAWRGVTIVRAAYEQSAAWKDELLKVLRDGDTLIDILGTDLATTYDAARKCCAHVINCGSVWMLGTPRRMPCVESVQTALFDGGYKSRWEVIREVLAASMVGGTAFTAILPPNICGPGKIPLETKGGRSIDVHRALLRGKEVLLPEGADVLIGPCDAEDIAQSFLLACGQPQRAAGQIFNVGSAYALTAPEFVMTYAQIYGVKIPISRIPWQQFATAEVPDPRARYHFEAHMCPDITKIRKLLGFEPRYTPEQAMERAVNWMRQEQLLN
jgi:nucleoside-diphosphate-sugar epimerase